ncbi:fa31b1cf-07fc-4fee-bb50-6d7e9742dfcf [Sclerotinia trifoliorum]|uniref:Fa31b1cf-07fc-4fee-bb50-6d7e9742dfcf n=1 Tax=Sclerotinia trifoliorum TaxID=28548 RepID=A0A8H2W0V2_9HELO|nr:fa31b1cf-07fc-4fee-bb50-6d7e9742dfcf [Sclerotinia trifoliorum]
MNTSTQRELQNQEDASRNHLVVKPVEDRISGSGMASLTILGEEIMKDKSGPSNDTQIESERDFISVTGSSPSPAWSSENNSVLSENEKFEAACYSLDMLDFFEKQCHSLQKRYNLDPTVPVTSFTLVIWAELEATDYCDDMTKTEFCVRHARSATNFPASLPSSVLRSVNYLSRQLFLEHYSYLRVTGDANKTLLLYPAWDGPPRCYPNIKWEISDSSKDWSKVLPKTGSNQGYWSKVDVKPVWTVRTVEYSFSRYNRPLHLRCKADGTLPDQYDQIKELFDDEVGGDAQSSVNGEALIVIDND